jgi:hypothetical protein
LYNRLCWSLGLSLGVLLVTASLARAQDERQMTATFKTGAIYTPERWLPTQITLRNPTSNAVNGTVSMTADSSAGPYELTYPVDVPAMAGVRVEMLARVIPPDRPRGKQDKPEPAALLFWRSSDGAELAREPIYAVADSASLGGSSEATGVPGVLVLYVSSDYGSTDVEDPSSLAGVLGRNANFRFTLNAIDPARLSRRSMALDAVRLIVIDQSAIASIDPTQQQALLDHVGSGATLLVVAHDPGVSTTWLGPLLPMDIVGTREAAAMETSEFPTVKYTQVVSQHVSITRPGAVTVASTGENTLAAYREWGFGRIAMVGFPINALDAEDIHSTAIWTAVVGSTRLEFHDPAPTTSELATAGNTSLVGVMPSMVGAAAPPWKTAAVISLAYTGAVAVALLLIGAKRRPVAIAGCVVGGVGLAGVVLGMSAAKSSDEPLMLARLSVVDMKDTVAKRSDTITFFGNAPTDGVDYTIPDGAAASAIVATGKQPPRVTMFPFGVRGVSSSTGSFASVWEVNSVQRNEQPISASITFGPDGAAIDVVSPTETLLAPRLLFGGSVMPISDLAGGQQRVPVRARNFAGDYSGGGGMIADEESKIRTDILTRVETRRDPILGLVRRSLEPRLVGFAADDRSGVETSVDVVRRGQTLVRAAVDIKPTPVGSDVRIDPGFVEIRRDAAISLPYRAEADAWSEASQGGPWLVGLAAPRGAGKLDPKQLTLDLDLRATGYQFTIQRGQVSGGQVRESLGGEVVLEWNNADAVKRAAIELSPEDVDANGWVWLRISATPTMSDSLIGSFGGGTGTIPNWRMLRFDATLSGTIVAPPQPVITTWATATAPQPTPKQTPKPKPKK